MANEIESFEHLRRIREACLSSAEDLLNSAKALLESEKMIGVKLAIFAIIKVLGPILSDVRIAQIATLAQF